MRVTSSSILQSQATHLSMAYRLLLDAQSSISSGKRLLRPSDDPGAFRQSLDVHGVLSKLQSLRSTAAEARGELSLVESTLRSISDALQRGREIALEGGNGARGAEEREALAQEVQQRMEELSSLLSTRGTSGYLFGGTQRSRAPFEMQSTSDGEILRYVGGSDEAVVGVGDSLRVGFTLVGSRLLEPGSRGTPLLEGLTGALVGNGRHAGYATEGLLLQHVQTFLETGSGIALGESSGDQDTVLGPGHVLTVVDTSGDGSAGTVSLNGGPPTTWTRDDQDLAVLGSDGMKVHLDFSAVQPGFDGSLQLSATGTLSLDEGQTAVDIDFGSDAQLVRDSQTGSTLFVDARGIKRTGRETVRFPGTYDPFTALRELRDALRDVDGLGQEKTLQRVGELISELDRNQDRVNHLLADVGARMRTLDAASARTTDLEAAFEARRSELEDADLATAALQLSTAETQLQAILALSARLSRLPTLAQLL